MALNIMGPPPVPTRPRQQPRSDAPRMVIDGPDAPIPPSSIPATVPGPSSQSDQQAQSSNSQQTEEVVAHNPAKVQSQTDESVVQTQQNESEESSQEVAQSFQEFWGKLHPCSGAVKHVDLRLDKWEYTVGRHSGNDIVLNGAKISNHHCVISYNGQDVSVLDKSSNGTWISGVRIPRNSSSILRSGNELSLGAYLLALAVDDFRWIFRQNNGNTSQNNDGSGFWEQYELGSEIGRGSFATVHRCMKRTDQSWFAVKIIHRAKWAHQPSTEKNFRREIEIMTRLDHPNIIKLQAVFETPDNYSVVMDEIKGGELLSYINDCGGLEEPVNISFTRQMCRALAHLHSRGITHRDLKPENILMTEKSPNALIKVADFGLAKVLEFDTWLKTVCGTPSYLAPEVISSQWKPSKSGYTDRVDSWSAGVIVYAMATNAGAFIEDDELPIHQRILERIINWEYLRLEGKIGAAGIQFIEKLLEINPEVRMSLTDALDDPWLSDPYAPPAGENPFALLDRTPRDPHSGSIPLGDSSFMDSDPSFLMGPGKAGVDVDASMRAVLGDGDESYISRDDSGTALGTGRDPCSQEMQKLHISGGTSQDTSQPASSAPITVPSPSPAPQAGQEPAQLPSFGFRNLPSYEPDVDSKGNVKVPGLSVPPSVPSHVPQASPPPSTGTRRSARGKTAPAPAVLTPVKANGRTGKKRKADEDQEMVSPESPAPVDASLTHSIAMAVDNEDGERPTKTARYSEEQEPDNQDSPEGSHVVVALEKPSRPPVSAAAVASPPNPGGRQTRSSGRRKPDSAVSAMDSVTPVKKTRAGAAAAGAGSPMAVDSSPVRAVRKTRNSRR